MVIYWVTMLWDILRSNINLDWKWIWREEKTLKHCSLPYSVLGNSARQGGLQWPYIWVMTFSCSMDLENSPSKNTLDLVSSGLNGKVKKVCLPHLIHKFRAFMVWQEESRYWVNLEFVSIKGIDREGKGGLCSSRQQKHVGTKEHSSQLALLSSFPNIRS